MSKINLSLDYSVPNGKQLSFVAPCNSATADGLVINGVTYSVCDSKGNNLLGVKGIWAKDAVVSVILNTDTCIAYIQNPGTPVEPPINASQGRSAKYRFTTPGWKRVLNIIRTSGGMVNFGVAQSSPLYSSQALGIVFSGFVEYGESNGKGAPVLYKLYENVFGEIDAMKGSGSKIPGRITKVRIGYPEPTQNNYDNGTQNAIINPINCYLDVYVEFSSDVNFVEFNMNYSGFSNSHNCTPVIEETDGVSTGVYGEDLIYYTQTVDTMPYMLTHDKIGGGYGLKINTNGYIGLEVATEAQIDAAKAKYLSITPTNVKYAVQKYAPTIYYGTQAEFDTLDDNFGKEGDIFVII